MTQGTPRYQWSELNDKAVIEAMLMNADSEHWHKCSAYIRYYIEKQFPNLPPHLKDDTIQDILLSVHKSLSTFRHQSTLTTWLASIARNRAIDVLRQQAEMMQRQWYVVVLPESHESDIESSISNVSRTPEEIVLTQERMQEVFAMIEAFLRLHTKPERNRQILQMVLLDDYSYEDTAQILGVNAPVVGYIARSARIYLRQQLLHAPETKELPE
jgi:RNA polymerase sigma factor (sigma-70 family)